jgi:hypothetical protein
VSAYESARRNREAEIEFLRAEVSLLAVNTEFTCKYDVNEAAANRVHYHLLAVIMPVSRSAL